MPHDRSPLLFQGIAAIPLIIRADGPRLPERCTTAPENPPRRQGRQAGLIAGSDAPQINLNTLDTLARLYPQPRVTAQVRNRQQDLQLPDRGAAPVRGTLHSSLGVPLPAAGHAEEPGSPIDKNGGTVTKPRQPRRTTGPGLPLGERHTAR